MGDMDRTTPNGVVYWRQRITQNGSAPEVVLQDQAVDTWTDTFIGSRNPRWKSKIRRGSAAGTSLFGTKQSVEKIPGLFQVQGWVGASQAQINWRSVVYYGDPVLGYTFGPNPNSNLDIEAYSEASGKFYRKAVNARRSLQAGVFIAELAKTYRMVKGSAHSIMGLLTRWNNDLRRSKRYIRTKEHRLKYASDKHLEFQFGMKPLMADINGALDLWVSPRREIKRITGTATLREPISPTETDSSVGAITLLTSRQGWQETTVKFHGAVKAQVPGVRGYAQQLGLYPADFVPSLYELLPWSFLVDYVSNLGGIIDALSFPKADLAWCLSTIRKETVRLYVTTSKPSPLITKVFKDSSQAHTVKLTRKTVQRTPIPSPPMPSFELKIPGRTVQWVNMSALVAARAFKYWP
jgi:hypothetical protein